MNPDALMQALAREPGLEEPPEMRLLKNLATVGSGYGVGSLAGALGMRGLATRSALPAQAHRTVAPLRTLTAEEELAQDPTLGYLADLDKQQTYYGNTLRGLKR